ncbi:MAG: tRNA (adenosine(37)-N6)-threonylcarbamoyltransferase complex dimerization subunit type 1 TsaB [Oscillospiraceae bacterium]|nr:tRNA (adenosine(37)-N6)-threonylcarbamoyltransferase complex dimerization subunit type 1 TsaB [Oscillospiraceae bacterium]
MRILGLDTSGKVASAAVLDTERDLLLASRTLYTERGHSQVILPMVQDMLAGCGLATADIDCYAVSVGPGSYTGLRIGIAAVQGMAMVRETPCIGVSTLAAAAAMLTGDVPVLGIMHARAELFYAALFRGERVTEDALLTLPALTALLAPYDRVLLVGDGAQELMRQYTGGTTLETVPTALRLPTAAGVCTAAAKLTPGAPQDLTASYLQAVNITKKGG